MDLNDDAIQRNINLFEESIHPYSRYSSFDHCYNYFVSFHKNKQLTDLVVGSNLRRSCLEIGFFLASWGMYRGKSTLLKSSFMIYEALIKAVSESNPIYWEIDVADYRSRAKEVMDCKDMIRSTLPIANPSETLLTKIMLGIYANVPAFDRFFRSGSMLDVCDKTSLYHIYDFYKIHQDIIERNRRLTCHENDIDCNRYSAAKVIDMIFFIEGMRNDNVNNDIAPTEEVNAQDLVVIGNQHLTIAEEIMCTLKRYLKGNLDRSFSRQDVRDAGGFDHHRWQQSCNVVFQGMRVDQHNPNLVNARFPNIFKRIAHGRYVLTDEGRRKIAEYERIKFPAFVLTG